MTTVDFQQIRAQFSMVEVVARYIEIKKAGPEYKANCPFHEEKTASFTIYRASDGTDKFHCFGCGSSGDVIDFVAQINNVETIEAVKILTGNSIPAPGTFKPKPPPPTQEKCWDPILPVPDDAPPYNPKETLNPKHGRVVPYNCTRVDPYLNQQGKLLCYVVRLEFPDGVKICPTITYCEGPGGRRAWCAQRMDPPFPLQGLDELAKRPNDFVMVVSGEKCKEAVSALMPAFVVVSPMGGDQAVGRVDISPLQGRNIYFFPDADPSGNNSMSELQTRLGIE